MKHPEIVHRLKVGLEKIKADENYNPTALEQPEETLTIEELNALLPRRLGLRPDQPSAKSGSGQRPNLLKKIGGKIAAVSSFQPGREAAYILDGDPSTFWHARFTEGALPCRHR
mgnify:FL=1